MTPGPGTARVAAVDLGATSGRVMVGTVGPDTLHLEEVHRFPNAPVARDGGLHWDLAAVEREMLVGLRRAASDGPLHGIGIDSWAVDHGLLDASGRLLGDPWCYRDGRTDGVADRVAALVPDDELFAVNGLQRLPFNTIYQLVADERAAPGGAAATMLLLPDLLGHRLTGVAGAERTNASTTGLYDVRTQAWATGLAARVGLDPALLPPLRSPGDLVGPVLGSVDAGLAGTPVIAVGSHDTASAVVAVPAEGDHTAYLSSGTWSLVGLELGAPVLSEAARAAGFTNEGGVDETFRFLTNVMGLWVLSESLRAWGADLAPLLEAAAASEPLRTVVDIDDPSLLPPGTGPTDAMPARIAALARAAGEPVPRTPAEATRCILDSLALAYRRAVGDAAELADRRVDVLHLVGGGARNTLLCRLTADACGVPVLAGPEEASALGNVLVQARALGADLPDLAAMRALVRRTHHLRRHEPRGDVDWAAAATRLRPRTGSETVTR